jgi:hypothetical protein
VPRDFLYARRKRLACVTCLGAVFRMREMTVAGGRCGAGRVKRTRVKAAAPTPRFRRGCRGAPGDSLVAPRVRTSALASLAGEVGRHRLQPIQSCACRGGAQGAELPGLVPRPCSPESEAGAQGRLAACCRVGDPRKAMDSGPGGRRCELRRRSVSPPAARAPPTRRRS